MKKVFLSYASKDQWVREWLVPHLDGYALELLVDYKSFKIGPALLQNIEDSIDTADFTFFVVSHHWLASEWATLENLILQTDSPANNNERFFLLKLEDCQLPRRLRPFTYLDLTDAPLQATQIKRLMNQLGIPQLTTRANADAQLQISGSNPFPLPSIAPAAIPPTPEPPIEIPPLDSLEAVVAFNQANIERLQEQLSRPSKVIPFVGAGLSASYGFKGWWDFLMHLAGQFGVTRQIEQLLSNNQYEEAAQFLIDKMKPHAFHTAIEDEYGPKKLKAFNPNVVSQAMVRLTAGPVITTNYDAVIEKTFKLAGKEFERVAIGAQISATAKAIESHQNILFKMHGDAEETTNRILTLEEYKQHYGDVDLGGFDKDLPLPKALNRLMGATPLFFLGCSLQVDRTMKVLAAITNDLNHGGHYAIVSLPKDPNDLPARRSALSELHIHPIWFDPKGKHGYGMVEELMGFLVGKDGPEPKADAKSTVGIQKPYPQNISLSRLPDTSGLLFGREEELKLLDEAWENPHIHVVSFVAQGGEGKTALTRRWVNNMEKDGFRGAERVYAWSFYSQGTSEDRQVSGDLFLAETLTWFGDAAMANSPASARQKAQRLATLVRQQKTLLILDGVEPLQYPPGEPHNGRMRDEGVKVLLKELMGSNSGLCVVSTRQEIRELNGGLVLQQPLSPLSESAGADLLAELGVKGLRKELEITAKEYHGHALALTLLGNLLREYHDGDIRQRDLIAPLEDEDIWGSHAKRVLGSYAKILEGKPELGILRIMSLFDRPADVAVVIELRKGPAIPVITEALVGLTEMEWKRTCKHLRDLGLLEDGDSLDCHPLIREHFASELSREHEEAWKEAHRRLYEYYKALPEKEFPDTLEEMEPLYRAMGHGCKAEVFAESFWIYWRRIRRENEAYSLHSLGAFSSDLAAMVPFFESLWDNLRIAVGKHEKAAFLTIAAFCLRALGRIKESISPNERALKIRVKLGDMRNASTIAANQSEALAFLGNIRDSILFGKEALHLAKKENETGGIIIASSVYSSALVLSGKSKEPNWLLSEAEELVYRPGSESDRLSRLLNSHFRDVIISNENWEKLERAVNYTMPFSIAIGFKLDIALDYLYLSQALQYKAKDSETINFLTKSIEAFRQSNRTDYLPKGLLARAALYRDMQDYQAAQADLAEVLEVAYPEMRLHLTDYHLESARLCLAMGGKHPEAQDHYEKAKKLIDDTGYHRRDGELEELRVKLDQILGVQGYSEPDDTRS